MAHKQPPVPPDQKSPKPGNDKSTQADQSAKSDSIPENLREQGRQGNIHQNTHNQGYQQDR
jgi:hypothetical protein